MSIDEEPILSSNARKIPFLHARSESCSDKKIYWDGAMLRSISEPEKITNLDFLTDSRHRSVNMSSDWTLKRYAWWLKRKPFNVSVVKSQQTHKKRPDRAMPDRAVLSMTISCALGEWQTKHQSSLLILKTKLLITLESTSFRARTDQWSC